mmetsp:Transcript_16102/g.53980  ORF Transcript_16102/g.53980 Transcript_16102/m.53980 type:complete len:175 (+) Transcript_16102:161-685(+)
MSSSFSLLIFSYLRRVRVGEQVARRASEEQGRKSKRQPSAQKAHMLELKAMVEPSLPWLTQIMLSSSSVDSRSSHPASMAMLQQVGQKVFWKTLAASRMRRKSEVSAFTPKTVTTSPVQLLVSEMFSKSISCSQLQCSWKRASQQTAAAGVQQACHLLSHVGVLQDQILSGRVE